MGQKLVKGPSSWNILVISNLETEGSFMLFNSKTKKLSRRNSNCGNLASWRHIHKEKQGQEMERGSVIAAPRSPSFCTWSCEPVIPCFPSL